MPRAVAFRHDVLPLAIADGVLAVAIPDPPDARVLELLRATARLPLRAVPLARDEIRDAVRSAYGPSGERPPEDDAPAIRRVDDVLRRAIASHASDVHVEPRVDGARIRFRIDGVLREVETLPATVVAAFLSRLKLIAGCDIAERRLPQDGRCTIPCDGRSVDARVSTVPTVDGEKAVVRLLDRHGAMPRLAALGMSGDVLDAYRVAIAAPSGFIVVSGPTGSGKTTTLYASLAELDADVRNVCSVEDPVEMRLPGVTQVQVNARAGLSFAAVLRAFLRQDPGVLMVGELRDAESAAVASAAALSGQLVFTSLHAPDAPRSIDRLLELAVPRITLAAALRAVVAQRLVRVLCHGCRATSAGGCRACDGTGYLGRTGVYEVLRFGDALREAVAAGASSTDVRRLATADALYRPMRSDALEKARQGITSREELVRVLGPDAAT